MAAAIVFGATAESNTYTSSNNPGQPWPKVNVPGVNLDRNASSATSSPSQNTTRLPWVASQVTAQLCQRQLLYVVSALKRLLRDTRVDGAVVLGIIESGETKHGFVMAQAVINAIIDLQLEFMKPVGVGIIGPEILPSQIPSRVRPFARRAVQAVAQGME